MVRPVSLVATEGAHDVASALALLLVTIQGIWMGKHLATHRATHVRTPILRCQLRAGLVLRKRLRCDCKGHLQSKALQRCRLFQSKARQFTNCPLSCRGKKKKKKDDTNTIFQPYTTQLQSKNHQNHEQKMQKQNHVNVPMVSWFHFHFYHCSKSNLYMTVCNI